MSGSASSPLLSSPGASRLAGVAISSVRSGRDGRAALAGTGFTPLSEGTCAQTLHVGPFSEEGPTIEKVHEFIRARGKLVVGLSMTDKG